jgi:hypothetical protein
MRQPCTIYTATDICTRAHDGIDLVTWTEHFLPVSTKIWRWFSSLGPRKTGRFSLLSLLVSTETVGYSPHWSAMNIFDISGRLDYVEFVLGYRHLMALDTLMDYWGLRCSYVSLLSIDKIIKTCLHIFLVLTIKLWFQWLSWFKKMVACINWGHAYSLFYSLNGQASLLNPCMYI